jgi:hypothetical protein
VDYYWPALIGGVQEYSDKDSLDYVGFSNGCRVALSSLEDHADGESNVGYYYNFNTGQYEYSDLSADPVSTFIGVGCPGAFEGESALISNVRNSPNSINRIQNTHITGKEVAKSMNWLVSLFVSDNCRISRNLWQDYFNFIQNTDDNQPGISVSFDKALFISGMGGLNGLGNEEDDGIVTVQDTIEIMDSLSNGTLINKTIKAPHESIANDIQTRNLIRGFLEEN